MSSKVKAPDVGQVFSRRLQQSRKAAAWTQERLSDETGAVGQKVDRVAVSRIEAGSRSVSLSEALVITAALGLSLEHLLTPMGSDELMRVGSDASAPTFTSGDVSAWLHGDAPLPGQQDRFFWGMGPIGRNPVATALRGAVKHAEAAQDARQATKVAQAAIAQLQGLLPMLALDDED